MKNEIINGKKCVALRRTWVIYNTMERVQLQQSNNKCKLESVRGPDRRAGAPDAVRVKKNLGINEPLIALCGQKIKCQRCWLFKSHHAGQYYESRQPQRLNPAAICSLNKRKVILCTPHQHVHKRSLFICSLPKQRSLDASFHQLMEVKGEHEKSNGALVLHRIKIPNPS